MSAAARVVLRREIRFPEDLLVGPQDGFPQDPVPRPRAVPRRALTGHVPGQDLHGHGAGHFAGGVPADAVGYGQQGPGLFTGPSAIQRDAQKSVLVAWPPAADVGQSRVANVHVLRG
jgi:hypothetical protein